MESVFFKGGCWISQNRFFKKIRSKYMSNHLKTLGRKNEGRPFGNILIFHVLSVFAAGEPGRGGGDAGRRVSWARENPVPSWEPCPRAHAGGT